MLRRYPFSYGAVLDRRFSTGIGVFDTIKHLLTVEGSKDFKRMHSEGVLYTPGLSNVPRSVAVYHTLRANASLHHGNFEAVEFMEGAQNAYPFVMKLIHSMDHQHSVLTPSPNDKSSEKNTAGQESGAEEGAVNGRREATEQLAAVLSPRMFEVVVASMGDVASKEQSWRLLEVNVTKAWVNGIATFDGTGAYSGEAAAVAEDDDPFEKPPGEDDEGDTIRVEVCIQAQEKYEVEMGGDPEPIVQEKTSTNLWTFERLLSAPDKTETKKSTGGATTDDAGLTPAAAAEEVMVVAVSLTKPMGMTLEEADTVDSKTLTQEGVSSGSSGGGVLTSGGLKVRLVAAGGAAESAGVQAGDVLVEVEGTRVGEMSFQGTMDLLRGAKEGKTACPPDMGQEQQRVDATEEKERGMQQEKEEAVSLVFCRKAAGTSSASQDETKPSEVTDTNWRIVNIK